MEKTAPLKKILIRFGITAGILVLFSILSSGIANAAAPSISSVTFKAASTKMLVIFSEPVFNAPGAAGGLAITDFTYTDGDSAGATSISSLTHTAGKHWAILTMNAAAGAGDTADRLSAAPSGIYTATAALSGASVAPAADAGIPSISTVTAKNGSKAVLLTFSEPVFTNNDATGDLAIGDITYDSADGQGAGASVVDAVSHTAGSTYMVLSIDGTVLDTVSTNDITGGTHLDGVRASGAAAIYDTFGNAMGVASVALTNDATVPTITSVEAVVGSDKILVTFSEPVFSATDGSGNLASNDFAVTASSTNTLDGITQHTARDLYAILDLSANVVSATATGELSAQNYAQLDSQGGGDDIYDALGNAVADAEAKDDFADTRDPVILAVTLSNASNKNIITVTYSEPVTITGVTSPGTSQASTTAFGDLTTAGTLAGVGAWATVGNITATTLKNSVLQNAAQTSLAITLAGETAVTRYLTAGTTEMSGVFTPTATAVDLAANGTGANTIATTSVVASTSGGGTFDLTGIAAAGFQVLSATSYSAYLSWTVDATGDFQRYQVYYGTAAGVTYANGTAWSYSDVAALTTQATTTATLTGLTSGRQYYATLYVIDGEGNLGTKATEVGFSTNASKSDRTPPAAPSGGAVTMTPEGKVKLTWTDPTATDLRKILILRGKDPMPISGTPMAEINKALQVYVDTDVQEGDKVSYILRASDTSNNISGNSNTFSITVTAPTIEEDEVPPQLTNVEAPASNQVVLTFSEVLKNETILTPNFAILDAVGTALEIIGVALSEDGLKVTLTTVAQTAGKQYTATVGEGVTDISDNPIVAGANDHATFTGSGEEAVADEIAPTLQTVTSVDANTVKLTFSEIIKSDTLTLEAFVIKDLLENALAVTALERSDDGIMITLTTADQTEGTTYKVVVAETVTDGAGNPIDLENNSENFVYEVEEEVTAPEEEEEEEEVVAPPVSDVPANHWARESINLVREAGIMTGKVPGEFRPADKMTRAEAAKVIAMALGSGELSAADIDSNLPFKDVSKSAWYAPYVSYIWENGVVMSRDAYNPGQLTNRAELITMILKAKGVSTEAGTITSHFADVPSGSWYDKVATVAFEIGMVEGKPKNDKHYFEGNAEVTRAEAAVMIVNAIALLK